jgi:hypothetical protein
MKKLLFLLFLPVFGFGQTKVTISPNNSAITYLNTQVDKKANIASPTFTGTPAAPTAAASTATTQLATTAFAWNEARQRDMPRTFYDSILGSHLKAQNIDGWGMTSAVNGSSLVNQRMFFSVVGLPRSDTITGGKWKQVIAGDYTSSNYNGIAVYSLSGGTATLVASSTNDGNIWKASANTVGSKAFSSSIVLSRGVYVVAILWCRSAIVTVPQLAYLGTSSAVSSITDYTNSYITSGYIDAQTSFPSSFNMSSATFVANEFWLGLYK